MSATQSQPSGLPLVEPKAPAELLLTETMHVQQQAQPMDLANSSTTSSLSSSTSHLANNRGPSVVQFRPVVRATFATQNSHNTATTNSIISSSITSGKTPLSGNTLLPNVTPSIISVNRNSNVTFLPTRGTGTSAGGIPTYQIARTSAIVGNIRAGTPGSITVTPMSSSNFSANIRLGTTVNNGSWIQTTNPQSGSFTPIRATTIISTVRQDGKMLQIPHQQGVQHLTQLQMVDNKGSIIRSPQITPLVNVRGIHPQSTNSSLVPLPQFTIRAANINLPLQQRPQTTNSNTANLMQKVIHQPGQGQPIQLLNTQKLPPGHTIQTITPISRLNTVCLTLTSNATLTPNSNPIVAMASTSRQGGSTPTTNTTTNNMQPITKVYPVRGDGSLEVGTIITHHSNPSQQSTLNNNIQSTSGSNQPTTTNTTNLNQQQHHLVQVHGLSGLPGGGGGNITSYYLDQKNNLQARPIGLDNKSKTTTMILATPVTQPNQAHGYTQQHAIPIHQQQHHLITTTSTGQQQLHAIPTQLITQSGGIGNKNSNTSINTPTTTTGVNVPLSSQNVGTPSTTTISNTSSTTTNISSSNTLTVPSSSTASTTTSSSATPVQSPSQSKSTLSPRPSILRKRAEAASGGSGSGDVLHQTSTLRAQRNLALNFATMSTSSASSSLGASVSANLMTNSGSSEKTASTPNTPTSTLPLSLATSLSILKKEFQPPNEESCSSNSSSGSSTISTTSETAELQLQQQQFHQQQSLLASNSSIGLGMLHHASTTISSKDYINSQISSSSYSTNKSSSQNGMPSAGRSVPVLRRGQQGNKAFSKELDRVKGIKAKEESVSPRKKPRKQQLTSSEILDTSPEISFYQGKGKRLKRSDMMRSSLFEDFDEKSSIRSGHSIEEQQHPPQQQPPHVPPKQPEKKIVYYIKRPQISLLSFNKSTWKPRLNHFERYAEVKSKDEKRPTVNDLANQKGVFQKINGWKVQHLSKQMDEIIDLESNVVANFNTFLSRLEEKHGPNSSDRDLNRIQELLKGNIQRCKVIRDQMTESRCQVSRILDHKPRLLDVINKYVSKRPIKKRERL